MNVVEHLHRPNGEMADTLSSGGSARERMGVQVSLRAHHVDINGDCHHHDGGTFPSVAIFFFSSTRWRQQFLRCHQRRAQSFLSSMAMRRLSFMGELPYLVRNPQTTHDARKDGQRWM